MVRQLGNGGFTRSFIHILEYSTHDQAVRQWRMVGLEEVVSRGHV